MAKNGNDHKNEDDRKNGETPKNDDKFLKIIKIEETLKNKKSKQKLILY